MPQYLAILVWMFFALLTHRLKWRSRYSLLFFHVAIRVASQACGVGFGVLGFAKINVFLAFLILGAEGYFTLVLCAFRFVISWHQHNLATGESWLEPRNTMQTYNRHKALVFLFCGPLACLVYRDNPVVFFHSVLMLANASIIIGGSYLAGADYSDPTSPNTKRRLQISKITRTAGQSVFLAGTTLLFIIILVTMQNNLRDGDFRKRKGKGTVPPTLCYL